MHEVFPEAVSWTQNTYREEQERQRNRNRRQTANPDTQLIYSRTEFRQEKTDSGSGPFKDPEDVLNLLSG